VKLDGWNTESTPRHKYFNSLGVGGGGCLTAANGIQARRGSACRQPKDKHRHIPDCWSGKYTRCERRRGGSRTATPIPFGIDLTTTAKVHHERPLIEPPFPTSYPGGGTTSACTARTPPARLRADEERVDLPATGPEADWTSSGHKGWVGKPEHSRDAGGGTRKRCAPIVPRRQLSKEYPQNALFTENIQATA